MNTIAWLRQLRRNQFRRHFGAALLRDRRRLKEVCDIPVFHDDQHGTAVVVLAALMNALKLVGKRLEDASVVTSGAGAAGVAIVRLLLSMGLKKVILCDRNGAIYEGRPGLNPEKEAIARVTNRERRAGCLAEVLAGADVFIGVSAPGAVTPEMIKTMAKDPILFPMANPTPEIMPELAKAAGAAIVGTGRSDFPNLINNVLAFPGIFAARWTCAPRYQQRDENCGGGKRLRTLWARPGPGPYHSLSL